MKKLSFILITVSLILTIIISCRKNTEVEIADNSFNLGLFSSDAKITNLSNFARFLGVNSLNRSNIDNNSVEYKLDGEFKNINNHSLNLDGAIFSYSKENENLINLNLKNKEKTISLVINSRDKSIFYKEKNIKLTENSSGNIISEDNSADISIAVSLLIELTNSKITRYDLTKKSKDKNMTQFSSCGKTLMSIRYTESSAESHLNSFANSYLSSHPDCHKIYGVDTGCLWGDYGCVATQEISCNGASCE